MKRVKGALYSRLYIPDSYMHDNPRHFQNVKTLVDFLKKYGMDNNYPFEIHMIYNEHRMGCVIEWRRE